ncbi:MULTISPECIES: SIS domain-containing protein [unclassified Nocardioides]|jgi:Bacterial phospho-glucose isomerase C-terminal SIS domain|uniref:SIS domain-containing protein n=1 Tax=Nocardioides sp. URHA0032 TaxID=1380388 RepID=UPI000490D905|nr:SIS domain-containing protein [Nocardioides sp. URHA0032]
MATWFDESRLDDAAVLESAGGGLRLLAETGARVRRDAGDASEATAEAVRRGEELARPRAVVAAGPDSRLLRAVLEPWCPVPFVAWPGPALPGWAGSLDLVVVLAPDGADTGTASAVAEAVRRGCQVIVACPPASLVADHAAGRWSTILPTTTRDQLATAVIVLDYLHRVSLGPEADAEQVADALDQVAIECSPHRDLAVNPAKMLAIALADANPLVWGGSVLAARAARRVAESIRRASGRTALAGDAEHLLPVLEATRPRDVFDDPFADPAGDLRPMLLVLDDGAEDPVVREHRGRLQAAAVAHGVRVETVTTEAPSEVARYASLLLSGTYAAEYLRIGFVED